MLAAHGLGLGSVPCALGAVHGEKVMKEELKWPDDEVSETTNETKKARERDQG